MMGNTKRNCKPKGGKGKFMKKNIFKKIVASLATAAMAVGMFAATPAQEAKAEEGTEKTLYVVVPEEDTNNYAVNIWQGVSTSAPDCSDEAFSSWGNKPKTMTKVQDGLFKMSVTVWSNMSSSTGMQIIAYLDGANKGEYKVDATEKNTYWDDVYKAFMATDSTEVWLEIEAGDTWTIKTTSPVEITKTDAEIAAEAVKLVDAALALDAKKDNLKAYEDALAAYNALTSAQKDLVDADKAAKVQKAVTDIYAAIDAANAGKLTVYVKNDDWKQMKVYGWDGAEFGDWPGSDLTALKNNAGWYSCSFDITKATNLIFNDGTTQTVDWNGVAAGTYWVTLSEKDADGKYLVDDTNVSTKAPEDWKDEAAQEIENSAPTTTTQAPVQTTTQAPVQTTTVPTIIPQADVDKIAASATITGAPADSSLKFSVISENEAKTVESFKSSTLKGMTFQALDIKLFDKDGNAVQPGSKVDITVALTDGLKNAKKVEVFRVDGDKLTSLGQVDAKDGKITFTTDHFSTYVFASVKSANKTGDMSSVAIMFAVAAMAGVAVMAMRKKTVNE